jgi:hypothetical protein
MNQIPEPPPPSSPLRGYLPSREQAPLLVAALGALLLTTAVVQPLIPAEIYSSSFREPAMSRGWQTFIVALLLVVTAGAVLRGSRRIPVATAGGVLVLGLGGLLINVFVIHREVSVLGLMTERGEWFPFASMFVLPFLVCVAMVLLAVVSDKGFASGILLATGAAGYFSYLQDLVAYLATPSPHPAPGRAVFIGMLGSAVTLVAGIAAHGDNALSRRKTGRTVLLVVVAAALAIVAAAAYGVVAYLPPSSSPGYAGNILSSFAFYVVAPALLVAAMCGAVVQRDPDPRMAAGVLIAGGFLAVVYFADSHVLEWIIPIHSTAYPAGPLALSGDIGVTAGLVLIATGIAMAVSARVMTGSAVPADRLPEGELTRSETTRYLCAAVQSDDGLTRRVIDLVVGDGRRAVVPSLGVDMGTVLRHSFMARRRQVTRDTLITAILLCFLPLLIDFRSLPGLRDMVILLVLAAAVALAERWISRYRVMTRQLSRASFDFTGLPWVTAGEHRRLTRLLASEHGNVSVYGTYSPFVGSGFSHGGWSFAVNTAKGKGQLLGDGKARLTPTPFDVEDLYTAVRADIAALGLDGIVIEERLLVDGRAIANDKRFIPDRAASPVPSIGAEQLRALVHAPELRNRAYLCARMQDWRGDLVISVFVNFTQRGSGLLAEVQYYLLAPLKEEYREVDVLASRPSRRSVRAELRGAPAHAAAMMVKAPFSVIGEAWRMRPWRNRDHSVRQFADADSEYNFGALTSVRELAQSGRYRKYFQQVDQDLNTKLISRKILDTIMDFLDTHNIDTSQFEEQRATILNQGLLISGGQVTAGAVAVGEGSRARTTQLTQALRRQGGGETT